MKYVRVTTLHERQEINVKGRDCLNLCSVQLIQNEILGNCRVSVHIIGKLF